MGIICVIQQERDLGFHLLSGDGEFGCHSEFINSGGVWKKMFTIALDNTIDEMIVQEVLEVLVFHIMIQVVIELGVINNININI